jgi:hypothetical protein
MCDLATGFFLDAAQIFANPLQITAELPSVLHAVTPYFFHNGIVHQATSDNSSGEQISGH